MTAAAIYARVSSARQAKDETIGSQLAALRDHAGESRLDVPEEWVFADEGHSGATLIRPGLELAAKPDLILDNGGDLFARYLDAPYDGLRGGTEETTSGRMRLEPLRDRLKLPILVINGSPVKQFAENEHAVGQSALESYLRLTNRVTNGEKVTVFGYGACGRGVAANFRGACARVTVVDVDPVTRLRAHLDGSSTPSREQAITDADLIMTVTGARDVLTAADLPLLRDGVIVANAGHFALEIDVEAIAGSPGVAGVREYADDLMTLELNDGRRIHVISRGHMFNLAGPRPMGISIESMDLGSALQARCLEAVANRSVDATSCVVPVPGRIDAAIAISYLDRKYPATPITFRDSPSQQTALEPPLCAAVAA